MKGVFDDLKDLFDNYDWQKNLRVESGTGTRGLIPKTLSATQVQDKAVTDDAYVITTALPRGIERQSGTIALRARIYVSILCFSRSLENASAMADAVWTILFAKDDSDGDRNYISGHFNTIRQVIPATFNILTPVKQSNGYWSVNVNFEAETQQSNTN